LTDIDWWIYQGWSPEGGEFTNQPEWVNDYGTVVSPTPAEVSAVPLPSAFWLLASGLIALIIIARRK